MISQNGAVELSAAIASPRRAIRVHARVAAVPRLAGTRGGELLLFDDSFRIRNRFINLIYCTSDPPLRTGAVLESSDRC